MKTTADKALIMKPSDKLFKIDNFMDTDFAGMYRHEAMDDPVCVKSRTGYVIMVANSPIMWSKLYLPWKLRLLAELIAVVSCFL